MKHEDFIKGFFASFQGKGRRARRSALLHRRFTGEKGIGRLAAHKLARLLIIESNPRIVGAKATTSAGIQAKIDWGAIERFETLGDIKSGIEVSPLNRRSPAGHHGTTISLKNLRRRWTSKELGRFINEVQTFTVPTVLLNAAEEH